MYDISTPSDFRKLCKQDKFDKHTSGCIPSFAQANVLVLPQHMVSDFIELCERNPVPCPLLAKTILGSPDKTDNDRVIHDENFDLRTDLPKYYIFKNSKLINEVSSLMDYWDLSNHIGFLIGCSFSFENALSNNGLTPKNVKLKTNVSMYKTTKILDSAGCFVNCPYVVSMRPYKLTDIEKVRDITRSFKRAHGEPIDWGYDSVKRLGISDLSKPEYGDPCPIAEDEIPVFWACGVTTQLAALTASKNTNDFIFSHAPGHMLILDIKDDKLNEI